MAWYIGRVLVERNKGEITTFSQLGLKGCLYYKGVDTFVNINPELMLTNSGVMREGSVTGGTKD